MDHLPTPKRSVSNERTIVPYVCMKDYDGGPFLTYPIREGITHALPPDGNIPGGSPYRQHEQRSPTPKQEQEDFLQRWLFFGLIHEILGDRYRPKELIRTIEIDDAETSIVSTSGLVKALDSWVADIRAGIVNPHHNYEHIAECLRLAFATIRGTGPTFDLRIKISLASLGELFTLAANEAFDASENNKCPTVFGQLIDDSYWEKSMLSSGWCPSQIKMFAGGSKNQQTLHFLTCLGQPACGDLHGKCNRHRCSAYRDDLPEYQTKHIAGCSCEHFMIDTKRLTEILETGYVPLLRIQRGHTLDELSVELVPSQSTSPYIALSHVWADGLGNSDKNALPRCQLDFLLQTINDYYSIVSPQATEKVLLWCDTLCCPVEPGKAKNIALTQMKRIYLEATRVLVLDASIRTYEYQTIDADEACIRILNSGWTRRLWTLQEGILPAKNHRLSFMFKDEVINAQKLTLKMFQIRESSVGRRGLADNIIIRMINFAPGPPIEYHGDRREDLGTIEPGLHNRSVSVSSDEPLLIANLLDLDVAKILIGPCPLANCSKSNCDHSRIYRMWLLMPTAFRGIPRNVLLRVGPRLSEPGFRWALSTLLYDEVLNLPLSRRMRDKRTSGSVSGSKRESTSQVTPTSRGLLVYFTGYSLSMAHCPPGLSSNPWSLIGQERHRGLYTRDVDGTWYQIARLYPVEQDSFLSAKSLHAIIKDEGNLWITHVESAWNNHELVAEAKGEQQTAFGLLVQLQSDEDGIKYVHSKLHISIRILEKSLRILLEAAYQSAKQVFENLLAKGFLPKFDVEQSEVGDVNSAPHTSVLEILEQEVHQVAIQNTSQDVTAAATVWSANVIVLFQEFITMMVVGGYGRLGPRTAEGQQWCFD